MGIKRNKAFSPYSYGIRYRKVGESPFRKYEYIPTGGQGEPIYVITKKAPEYFCSITNYWYFGINNENLISFLKVDSIFYIDKEKKTEFLKMSTLSNSYKSLKFEIKKGFDNFDYKWENERILNVFHNLNSEIDSIILLNDEYIDDRCTKYYHNGYLEVNFNNIEIKAADTISIVVYTISSTSTSANSEFSNNNLHVSDIIDDQLNNRYLIENFDGTINKKYVIKLNDNRILNISSLNILPTYILINKNDISNFENISSISSYSSIKSYKTFIVQRQIDNELITWDKNSVIINHRFNGNVNFIIDNFDKRKMISTIMKLGNNKIKITFNENVYSPTVFSITIFKIGD